MLYVQVSLTVLRLSFKENSGLRRGVPMGIIEYRNTEMVRNQVKF